MPTPDITAPSDDGHRKNFSSVGAGEDASMAYVPATAGPAPQPYRKVAMSVATELVMHQTKFERGTGSPWELHLFRTTQLAKATVGVTVGAFSDIFLTL
jgi:hypothetical protein